MSTKPIVNTLLGMTDDLIGGSSLMWRYHHQVWQTSLASSPCQEVLCGLPLLFLCGSLENCCVLRIVCTIAETLNI